MSSTRSVSGLALGCAASTALLIVAACGNDGNSNPAGSGGGVATSGGANAMAGSGAGAPANGGTTSGSGGATSGGVVNASGGAPSASGGAASGGAAAASMGGKSAQAGASAQGGSSAAGGSSAGASSSSGGASATGSGGGSSSGEPPSCAPGGKGLNTCGPNGNESCCTSLAVPGGMFYRTYTNSGSSATGTKDPATLSAFRLDKYETTVGRFRQFINYLANGGSPPEAGSGKHTHLNGGKGLADAAKSGSYETGWDSSWNSNIPTGSSAPAAWAKNLNANTYGSWTATAGANEELPITCIDWYEAAAFCIWDGGFLPSEAEWKYAAAGGDEQRRYPWGAMEPGTDSKYCMYDCYFPTGSPGNCTGIVNVAKVGTTTLGVGKWGQFDLSGSVWEWNLDVYANYASPCMDCANLSGGSNRVLPGGGFHSGLMPYMLSSNRQSVSYATTYRGDYGVGVRCARTP